MKTIGTIIAIVATVVVVQAHTFQTFQADFGKEEPTVKTEPWMIAGSTITTHSAGNGHGFFVVTISRYPMDADMSIEGRVDLYLRRRSDIPRDKVSVRFATFAGRDAADIAFADVIDGDPHFVVQRLIIADKRTQYAIMVAIDLRTKKETFVNLCDDFIKFSLNRNPLRWQTG